MKNGWKVEELGNLVKDIIDCEHKTPPYIEVSPFFVVRTPNVREGRIVRADAKFTTEKGFKEWTQRGVPEPGDVVLTREAPAGEMAVVPENQKICLGQRMVLLKPDHNKLDPRYLINYFYSPAIRKMFNSTSLGTTVSRINMKDIRTIEIAHPNISEQKKIAEILSIWDRAIDLTNSLINREEMRMQGTLNHLSEQLSGEGNNMNSLRNVVEKLCNGNVYDTKMVLTEGIAITRIETISDGKIDYSKTGLVVDDSQNRSFLMKTGDILFSHINSLAHLGKVAFYNGDRPLIHGMNLLLIRANEKIRPKFLYFLLRTPLAKKFVGSRAKKAINQASINTSELEEIQFLLPNAKAQDAIENALVAIETRLSHLSEISRLLGKQKQGLMQMLLTGKVRVKV